MSLLLGHTVGLINGIWYSAHPDLCVILPSVVLKEMLCKSDMYSWRKVSLNVNFCVREFHDNKVSSLDVPVKKPDELPYPRFLASPYWNWLSLQTAMIIGLCNEVKDFLVGEFMLGLVKYFLMATHIWRLKNTKARTWTKVFRDFIPKLTILTNTGKHWYFFSEIKILNTQWFRYHYIFII